MKQLMRRLARVADSSQYCLLRSPDRRAAAVAATSTSAAIGAGRSTSFRAVSFRLRRSGGVPEGHLPVYVGDEMERFVVSAELLNHPVFVKLLNRSAQEYGYEQKGALRIPCHVLVFERLMEALRLGADPAELQDLVDDDSFL